MAVASLSTTPSSVLVNAFSIVTTPPHSSFKTTTSLHATTATSKTTTTADLITFDLDDTIFPVGPVVNEANQALIKHLNECGFDQITQESLIASTKLIRNDLLSNENKVITYTELRQRAICYEMNHNHNDDDNNNNNRDEYKYTDSNVIQAYDIWEMNRHLAAERHLYHDTIPMLQVLKEKYPNAIIGAITNGKGNPLHMKQTICEYFDFCISGEDENVFPYRKPHEQIYQKSLDFFFNLKRGDSDDHDNDNDNDNDNDEEKKNICWVHVGDDLANDVGASAKCGALAVWADLNEEEYNQSASKRFPKETSKKEKDENNNNDMNSGIKSETTNGNAAEVPNQPFWSTATKEEIEKRKKLNDASMKFVSARIERLSDLPDTIQDMVTGTGSTETSIKHNEKVENY